MQSHDMEAYSSGLRGPGANRVDPKGSRGFESHRFLPCLGIFSVSSDYILVNFKVVVTVIINGSVSTVVTHTLSMRMTDVY